VESMDRVSASASVAEIRSISQKDNNNEVNSMFDCSKHYSQMRL
jgi:hypothetical protein